MPRFSRILLVSLLALGGCKRPQIVTYTAPKDPPPVREEAPQEGEPRQNAAAQPEAPSERPPHPSITYKAPENWVVGPQGPVTAVNFMIKGDGGEATVSVSPLSSFAGREAAIVNMWRQMAGAPPVSQDEALKQFTPIDIAGEPAQLFEVSGSREGKNSRIVTAMLHRPEGTWFFKLSGDDAVVTAQKPAFLAFLKTVQFGAPESTAAATSAPATSSPATSTPAPTTAAAGDPSPVTNPTPITNPTADRARETPPATATAIPVATPAPTHMNPAATPTAPVKPALATPAPALKEEPAKSAPAKPAPPAATSSSPSPAPATPAP